MSPLEQLGWLLGIFWSVMGEVWWLVLPVVLFGIFSNLWLFYLRLVSLQKMSWSMLEIHIPREVLRTPKAMEQIFAALAAIWPGVTFFEKWWAGKVVGWMSFEMVGVAHGVHFFIRTPSNYRNLIEAAVYAQYPEAEINEIPDDYTNLVPEVLPNQTYDLFGTNFSLGRDDAYPIRTYQYFEDPEEERRLDPLAAVTEVMSRLKEGEMIWLQLLVQPTTEDWKQKSDDVVNELAGENKSSKKNPIEALVDFIVQLIKAPFVPPEFGSGEVKKSDAPKNLIMYLTPIKKDVIKAIEEKSSKLGFKTNIRFIYIDNRASFTRANVSAVVGAMQQFNTKHLNALRPDSKTFTVVTGLFKERRSFVRKRRIFYYYKQRMFAPKSFIMNTEELATIFHFPASVVEAPRLGRLESKRGTPPSNLPIG